MKIRTYAVSCILVKGMLGGEMIHTLAYVDAEDESKAAGAYEDEALALNPGYRLFNTAALFIPNPWGAPPDQPATVAMPLPGPS